MVNKGSCSKLEQNKYVPISPQDWITFCIPVFFVSSKPVTDELLFCTSPGKLKGDGCICFFKPFCALIKSSCSGSEMVRSFPKKLMVFLFSFNCILSEQEFDKGWYSSEDFFLKCYLLDFIRCLNVFNSFL